MKGIFVRLESPQIWTPLNFDTFVTVSMNKLKKKKKLTATVLHKSF